MTVDAIAGVAPAAGAGEADFVAVAHSMRRVREALAKAAAVDVRLVLYGEPGTGRGFCARYVHGRGATPGAPLLFLAASDPRCTDTLGAPGFSSSMAGGTLVLERVDEASPDVQGFLVAAVEEWSGGEDERAPQLRILATASQDLLTLVGAGAFRKDLHYLLDVFPIALPPLRARLEEVPAYLEHFHRRLAPGKRVPAVSPEFVDAAFGYGWPGNLRELHNLVAASVARTGGEEWALPSVLPRTGDVHDFPSFYQAKREFEAGYVRRLLLLTGGNVSRAAEVAGKARKDFYALLARNGIDPGEFRR